MPFQDLRKELVAKISKESDILPGNNQFYHGKLVSELLDPPKGKTICYSLEKEYFIFQVTWGSTEKPVASMDDSYWSRNKAPDWLTATEFQDTDFCLDEKLDILVKLLKCSRYW